MRPVLACSADPLQPSWLGSFPSCLEVPSHGRPVQTLLAPHTLPPHSLVDLPSPTYPWQESIQRGGTGLAVCRRHQPAPFQSDSYNRVKGNNHIQRFTYGLNSRLGADIWSDCSSHPLTKASQGQHRKRHLEFIATTALANTWSDPSQWVAPDWTTNNTGTKLCSEQAKRAISGNRTEGKFSSVRVGCT